MSAIAGIQNPEKTQLVKEMLNAMSHRGMAGMQIINRNETTLGVCWNVQREDTQTRLTAHATAADYTGKDRFAIAESNLSGVILKRDRLGQAPLYYGYDQQGTLCFASEVKALLLATRDVHELPPGCQLQDGQVKSFAVIEKKPPMDISTDQAARELHKRLDKAVVESLQYTNEMGSWLSGGLDSSVLAALAAKRLPRLRTFVAGVTGSPDVKHAREVANFIGAEHYEVLVTPQDMLKALPQVIYHLESFDALLVRSSITNYLVARTAADYVPAILSGEGADELFAGYAYLKKLSPTVLPEELVDITRRLHNTALQRVDRSASAHGLTAFTPFLRSEVLDYALALPVNYKLHDGVEKWIVRQAMTQELPKSILRRPKAKFWEGAGVTDLLAQVAEEDISDADFARQRSLPDGSQLNSKEEMMYYRVFCDYFGDFNDLTWMGRTKGAPVV